MRPHEGAEPGTSRLGADQTVPRWSDNDLTLAWTLGYEARAAGEDALAAIDDARLATITPPKLSKEERIAADMAEMETCAQNQPGATWRGTYPGGPVHWNTGNLAIELCPHNWPLGDCDECDIDQLRAEIKAHHICPHGLPHDDCEDCPRQVIQ